MPVLNINQTEEGNPEAAEPVHVSETIIHHFRTIQKPDSKVHYTAACQYHNNTWEKVCILLIRYTTGKNGKPIPQAKIYTAEEHGLQLELIDFDAIRIARRLRRHGFQAYIVGGAVRDLLVGKVPKDFDMATDASPAQIRKLFRNSRIIGKRFRLVHIFFQSKIIEVTTFRSLESTGFNAVYGTIEEDAARRDFTLNSLYYDTEQNQVLDYTGGYDDIQNKLIKPVIPLDRIFTEDPVRTIRAVKYAERTGFRMTYRLRRCLLRSVHMLANTPPSRMSEEMFKIITSGKSAGILRRCFDNRMLVHMVPQVDAYLRADKNGFGVRFFESLEGLDQHMQENPGELRAVAIAYFCAEYFYSLSESGRQRRISTGDAYTELKELLKPVTPPNREVEAAVQLLVRRRKAYQDNGRFTVPEDVDVSVERKPKQRRRRRRRPKDHRTQDQ